MDVDEIFRTCTVDEIKEKLHAPDSLINKLNRIDAHTKHTKCGRRIITFYVVVLVAFTMVFTSSAFAANHALSIMKQKVEPGIMSDAELEQLYNELRDTGTDDDTIQNLEELKTNEYGQTYGPEFLNPDLILVESDEGIEGYVYRDEFYQDFGVDSPEKATELMEKVESGWNCIIDVYESDGRTVIGLYSVY